MSRSRLLTRDSLPPRRWLVEQPASGRPSRPPGRPCVVSGPRGPFEQARHLAISAIGRLEQSAVVAGTAKQAAVIRRAAEHAGFLVLVAAVGHIEEAVALSL